MTARRRAAKRARRTRPTSSRLQGLAKCPTGIAGLDEITEGGLPRGRPTLVCGAAGCGKTLLAMEFIVRGATQFGEPGAFVSFEETTAELAQNVASLGFDVDGLIRRKKLAMDFVRVERSEIEETGEYDLEALFVRVGGLIDAVGAKRVVLDTIEALFAGLPNEAILRAELRRLFRWLKDKGVTAVITGEQGEKTLTRHGLEEYVSDCVIVLDHRVANQVATRRLRIAKYRGSRHGTNEYPTLIDERGLSVLPISSLGLTYPVGAERVSSGLARLDAMLGGKGYFRGSSILVSGTAGTGKSSLAATFVDSVCRRGGKALYLSFEESPEQIRRNMTSIGIDLSKWSHAGQLQFRSIRPTFYGLEMHLATVHKMVVDLKPDALVMDPITNMMAVGDRDDTKSMLTRVIDFLKNRRVTALFTSLTPGGDSAEQSEVGISSLMDTWITIRMLETNGERNRLMYILKSRGMAHSNQVREFVLSDRGIQLVDAYLGPGTVLTGSSRVAQEAKDKAQAAADLRATVKRQRDLLRERAALADQLRTVQSRLADVKEALKLDDEGNRRRRQALREEQKHMARSRQAE